MSNVQKLDGNLKRGIDEIREMELVAFERGDMLTGFRLGAFRAELQRLAGGLPIRTECVSRIVGSPTLEALS